MGRGSFRAVFQVPEGALKIAIDPGGLKKYLDDGPDTARNLREALAWGRANGVLRGLLVPVLAVDPEGRWLLMEKVDPNRGPHVNLQIVDVLYDANIGDMQPYNFSKDGRLLDYGERRFRV